MSSNSKIPQLLDLRNSILWRIYVVMFLMFLGALIIVMRIWSIQNINGAALREKAKEKHIMMMPVEASRGNILADDGSLLATSLPYYEVRWDTKAVSEDTFITYVDTLAACLAAYVDDQYTIGAYRERLIRAREAGDQYLLIRRNVSYVELQRIKSFPIFNLDNTNKSGLIIIEMAKRQYPFKMLAHRTIGYKREIDGADNKKDTVSVGLERTFDEILSGEVGKRWMQRLSKDVWVPVKDISQIEPRAGKDIVTTIDINIQDIAEQALLNSVKTYDADHGCVIVMEVKTGAIKAIANIGFNADRTQYWEDYNYAVAENTEPGSTFKLASVMALLEDGYITLTDTVNLSGGKWRVYDEDLEDASAHGLYLTTVENAFEVSSNVGIAKLMHKHYNGTKSQQEKYLRRLNDMVLTKATGIEIDGEREPFIKDPSRSDWSGITIPWMSIGYELEMSPLQQLTFYNAVANGGQVMKPYLVREIRSYGDVEKVIKPQIVKRKIASKTTIEAAHKLLRRVVEGENGTAHSIYTKQYPIAGKTGTAIINYKSHINKGESKRYRATFAGFFPADNPVYSCIVVVTNPRNGFYGGRVAAPVFRAIADYCYTTSVQVHPPINLQPAIYTDAILPNLQVGHKADMMYIMKELKMPFKDVATTPWAVGFVENDSLTMLTRNIQDDMVPNVVGMGARDAVYLLENRGMKVKVVGVGKVKSQSIKPGRSTRSAQSITLVLG